MSRKYRFYRSIGKFTATNLGNQMNRKLREDERTNYDIFNYPVGSMISTKINLFQHQNKMKIIFLLILLFIISCNNRATKLHYYDGNINNGKYILASDLNFFFNNDIKKVPIKNNRVNKEISEIKQKIILKKSNYNS